LTRETGIGKAIVRRVTVVALIKALISRHEVDEECAELQTFALFHSHSTMIILSVDSEDR
jgi:hypothetical protein